MIKLILILAILLMVFSIYSNTIMFKENKDGNTHEYAYNFNLEFLNKSEIDSSIINYNPITENENKQWFEVHFESSSVLILDDGLE